MERLMAGRTLSITAPRSATRLMTIGLRGFGSNLELTVVQYVRKHILIPAAHFIPKRMTVGL